MILTDREIQISLEHGTIVVDPRPADTAFSSTSLDLTLDKNLREYKSGTTGVSTSIDPSIPGFDHDKVLQELTIPLIIPEGGYLFCPHVLILAWTREAVNLHTHSRIAARVEGKSSLARLGIGVHITAPTIHAGFSGQIRLEMVNHGTMPVVLKTGMKICQLIFEQTTGTPVRGYKGRFSGQTSERAG